uniref:Cytochrome c oxidase subunit 2 n=1 Tax=Pseudoniphargus carpalis TaxID=2211484 RepID=A0A345K5Q3_9CRUS|nr:cytochrome c oxidase subunit II [Pseudoniphargus carpalis]AXH38195.1 cytochrome c oxidase subunit 2 [Pseudoniphargus carpalis]
MPTWAMLMFQDSASPSMEQLIFFHDFAMIVVSMITALVGLNLVFISTYKLTDRLLLQSQITEIVWTLLPVFILLSVALPSLQALYLLDDPFSPNISVKAIGHQWYWSYEYSDFQDIVFDSYMLNEASIRLLETDNSLILPTHSQIRVITTASDVIHSWAVPSLGIKADAVPGRLNQLMFVINRPGMFFGQCSEICGANHSFMPIKIEAVPMKYFIDWVCKMS